MKRRKKRLAPIDKIFIVAFLLNMFLAFGIAGNMDLDIATPLYVYVLWGFTALVSLLRIAVFDIFKI